MAAELLALASVRTTCAMPEPRTKSGSARFTRPLRFAWAQDLFRLELKNMFLHEHTPLQRRTTSAGHGGPSDALHD